jgi:hypothetical protein
MSKGFGNDEGHNAARNCSMTIVVRQRLNTQIGAQHGASPDS